MDRMIFKSTAFIKDVIRWLRLSILHCSNPGCRCGNEVRLPWVDEAFEKHGSVIFNHGGGIGDLLFALYFCRDISRFYGREKFDLHILECMYGFLAPLLETQEYVGKVTCGRMPENAVDLNKFRSLKLNFSAGDIRNWYCNLARVHLPREFWKPVITVEPDSSFSDKIILCLTPRYRNVHIDYSRLQIFKDHLVFAGTQEEHRSFQKEFFGIPCLEFDDMLVLAKFIAGAKGFIGNQSGIYSLAECMKTPRILLAPEFVRSSGAVIPGPHNNHPQGGWCEDVSTTEKMLSAMEELINRK